MKNYRIKIFVIPFFVLTRLAVYAQQTVLPEQNDRWTIQPDGSILWNIRDRLPHADHIEMSGEKVSLWVAYRVDTAGVSKITRTIVFPTFRMLPDDTRSHISYTFEDNELPRIYIDNQLLKFDNSQGAAADDMILQIKSINHHGIM